MMKKNWIIGTRGSRLALAQTQIVIEALKNANPGHDFEKKTIKTTGDTIWDQPLAAIGGKGVFVKEIEDELARGDIDFAVHSTKDIPAQLREGLVIAAYLPREDPRDVFISSRHSSIDQLTPGCRVGTGSLRRKAQILRRRPGIEVVPLRGNVDTRIRKIETEGLDGIILAAAGIRRLGLEASITQIIPADIMVPIAGQGAIGIETRKDDEARILARSINDEHTFDEITIERAIQAAIGGGCDIPLGIYARLQKDRVVLSLSLGNEKGSIVIHETLSGSLAAMEDLMSRAIELLLGAKTV
ncbi:MAG: hydroxymethylbilane synthase [Syntrophorhabdaceae bacterium]